jgi:hypothetical protein
MPPLRYLVGCAAGPDDEVPPLRPGSSWLRTLDLISQARGMESIRPAAYAVEEGTAYNPKIGERAATLATRNKGGLTWLTTSFAFTQVPVIGRLSN